MTRILRAVLGHRLVVGLLAVIIVIGGLVSYYVTPKQEYPDIKPPMAMVTTVYPGAMPEDVERLVTREVEEEMKSISGYKRSQSRSMNGLSIVVLELEYGTPVEEAWRDLRNLMADLRSDLPLEIEDVHINTKLDETAGFIFAVSSDDQETTVLISEAERLKESLSEISGVTNVQLMGDIEQQLRIRVNTDELNRVPLSLNQISEMIQAQAASIPLGELAPLPGERVRVNVSRGIQGVEDVSQMILLASPETGETLSLGQIAEIQLIQKEDQQEIWHEGKPAVIVTGYFAEGRNVLFIGNEIQKVFDAFSHELPTGVLLEKLLFQPDDISRNVNSFALNLLQGILFVVIVVFLGMGFRNSMVVSSAIPLSILMTLILLQLFDIFIHQISIAALIIALGMLVDNAIVVSDAIQVRMDLGEERLVACIRGTRDVSVPVLTSTLTTVGAFLPLLMLHSIAGEYIKSVPQIVIIALASSYIVSVFFVPTAAFLLFKPRINKGRTQKVREKFYRLVDKGIKNPRKSLGLLAAMVVITIFIGFQLGLQFFPKADTDLVYVELFTELDQGTAHTASVAHKVSEILAGYPEVTQQSLSISHGFPKFYNTLPIPNQSRNYGQIVFRLNLDKSKRYKNMTQFTNALQQQVDQEIIGARVEVKLLEQADPIAAPVLVRVSSGFDEERRQAALFIRQELESIDGTINVQDDFRELVYEYQISPDDLASLRLGITRRQMAGELSLAMMGRNVANVTMDDREVDVYLESDLRDDGQMASFGILSQATGHKVPLHQIAQIDALPRLPEILKESGEKTITIKSDVVDGYNAVAIQGRLQQVIEEYVPQGVTITYAGEREEIIKYFGEVGVSAVFAIMIVLFILVMQFGGLRLPLLILLTIPFSAIGSITGLWVFRQPLSFTALLGLVSLFGIVVNNAIILLDYIEFEVKEGRTPLEACRHAVALRLRPILLTTTTTIMGLVPLILSGSHLFTPMAVSLMAGLAVSTFLTLVVLPVMYLLTDRTAVTGQKRSTD
ncbi:MAG: efflux RND transporter permease subunit [Bacillota bacterium]|nr:efflux RND transporter permease subunit [Bacillota bacterium]MDW7676332.1 efflux RND transporter permease subunit [Bacillota bacterium]